MRRGAQCGRAAKNSSRSGRQASEETLGSPPANLSCPFSAIRTRSKVQRRAGMTRACPGTAVWHMPWLFCMLAQSGAARALAPPPA